MKNLDRFEAGKLASKAYDELLSISLEDYHTLSLFISYLYNEGYEISYYPDRKLIEPKFR